VAAGDRAAELDAAAAEVHYARALELLPAGHPERAGVFIKAGVVAHQRGRLDEAAGHFEVAITEAGSRGDRRSKGNALAGLASVEWFRGQTERCMQLDAEAVALLEQEPPGPELVRAYSQLSGDADLSGNSAMALELADKASVLAQRLKHDRELVRARTARGGARCALGDLGGLDDLRQAVDKGLKLGLGGVCSIAYSALCDWTWLEEGPAAGDEAYREAIEFATKRGMLTRAAFARVESLRALFDLGRWDELRDQAEGVLNRSDSRPVIVSAAMRALTMASSVASTTASKKGSI
jgi:tetratricopeptide (TPR) repeat protein